MKLIQPEYGLIFWIAFSIFLLRICISAIVNIAKSDFTDQRTKLMWGLVVFLLPLNGSILYFSVVRNQKINNQ